MKKINSEDKRKGFVFLWGYCDAMQKLSNKNKLIAFEAIVQYERYQELNLEKLPKQVYPILVMAIPGIDKRIAEYNKKVAKKSVSDFEENSDREVALPLKKTLSTVNDDEFTESKSLEY